jgi:hypothetical protein
MPSPAKRSAQVSPVFKGLACRGCHRRAFSVVLATEHHLYLRCNHCGQPLAMPERRRGGARPAGVTGL